MVGADAAGVQAAPPSSARWTSTPRRSPRATDDASLIERAGGRVIVVPSLHAENIKVTTPFDLRVAELLLGERGRFGRTDPA